MCRDKHAQEKCERHERSTQLLNIDGILSLMTTFFKRIPGESNIQELHRQKDRTQTELQSRSTSCNPDSSDQDN